MDVVLRLVIAEQCSAADANSFGTIYGFNASVFAEDVDRALRVARRLRSGTGGHMSIAFGGLKQSGIGREGSTVGLLPYFEVKAVILDATPSGHSAA